MILLLYMTVSDDTTGDENDIYLSIHDIHDK